MREPVSSSSWLNETSRDFVAGVSFTGTVTSPKLIDPVQMVVGTTEILRQVASELRRQPAH